MLLVNLQIKLCNSFVMCVSVIQFSLYSVNCKVTRQTAAKIIANLPRGYFNLGTIQYDYDTTDATMNRTATICDRKYDTRST